MKYVIRAFITDKIGYEHTAHIIVDRDPMPAIADENALEVIKILYPWGNCRLDGRVKTLFGEEDYEEFIHFGLMKSSIDLMIFKQQMAIINAKDQIKDLEIQIEALRENKS